MASKEVSTRAQLFWMLSLPIVALVLYAFITVMGALDELRTGRHSRVAIEAAMASSQLIHEQQKERGLSGGFLASKGEQFRQELATQREATNQKLEQLKLVAQRVAEMPMLSATLGKATQLALSKALDLNDFRREVDAQSVKPAESFARYTAAIAAGVEMIGVVPKSTENADIAREATAYLMFVQAKEYAGRERATLNQVFTAKKFEPESFRRFFSIVSSHDLYMNSFRMFASSSARNAVDDIVKGSEVEEVARLRKLATDSISTEEFDVSSAEWFKASTARINLMKNVESKLDAQIHELLSKQETAAERKVIVSLLASLLSIVVALLIGGGITRRLMQRLGGEPLAAANIARAIAEGDLTQPISVKSGDTRSVMAAMRIMQDGLREMIGAVHEASADVTSEAKRLSASSSEVALSTSASSESATSIAAAVEQLSASIQSISGSSDAVDASSRQTGDAALRGGQFVQRTASEMKLIAQVVDASSRSVNELGQQSEQIASVAHVIREIADQTNLLALNAAIEAARAGEQGRGFAVVADEVRKLAERTRLSTLEITTTVEKIKACMVEADKSMASGNQRVLGALAESERAEASMLDIQSAASVVIASVEDIATLLREQSSSSQEITRNVVSIAAGSEQVCHTAGSMAGTAKHLESLASDLDLAVRRFRVF